jgi:esterase/lipase superfamily enzyme
MQKKNQTPRLITTGCSFGAFHAANFGFRHPDKVTGIVTMGGAFDMKDFVDGWYGEDLYFNNPPDYLANSTDPWKYNHIRTVLATGEWDFCWEKNERFATVLRNKGIRHELYVWGDRSFHDWPWWRPMARMYLE